MPKKTFTSLEKAIDILNLFDIDNREFSAKEISESLEIPLSSTYKYIDFLVKKQLLRNKPKSKMYGLGFMITRLGYVLEKDIDILDISRPHLEKLCKETGETAILTMIIGDEVISLDRVEPQRLVKFSLEPGRRLPLHIGATSKILLAFQDDQFIENYLSTNPLTKLTEKSISDPELLKADLETIRGQGYAVSNSEVDAGALAVSVPIFDQRGAVIAGLTVAGPRERINQTQTMHLCSMLKKRAEKIAYDLGFLNRE
ncbi:IclR family transcriptional regulator [Desulforhopalus singaporensis]|uniref:Transcriptional regulator, IclR family n=1 Tax=Desulforhopalus singaporensis TaxID=91360 RepID=A0A1H0VLJ0_9BACT|nr:IclR family transcriptional regulator [Desulforhopalus singaporensis]SDP79233.1 transcriptional regulator, IclR family [Desulforhopalus singaporensis]